MRKYKIAAILWEDHQRNERMPMVRDPDTSILPTLSVGIIYKSTKKSYVLISDIEKYTNRDDITFTIIRKAAVVGLQKYGEIELETLRE